MRTNAKCKFEDDNDDDDYDDDGNDGNDYDDDGYDDDQPAGCHPLRVLQF